jgi:hypothetical protein
VDSSLRLHQTKLKQSKHARTLEKFGLKCIHILDIFFYLKYFLARLEIYYSKFSKVHMSAISNPSFSLNWSQKQQIPHHQRSYHDVHHPSAHNKVDCLVPAPFVIWKMAYQISCHLANLGRVTHACLCCQQHHLSSIYS